MESLPKFVPNKGHPSLQVGHGIKLVTEGSSIVTSPVNAGAKSYPLVLANTKANSNDFLSINNA